MIKMVRAEWRAAGLGPHARRGLSVPLWHGAQKPYYTLSRESRHDETRSQQKNRDKPSALKDLEFSSLPLPVIAPPLTAALPRSRLGRGGARLDADNGLDEAHCLLSHTRMTIRFCGVGCGVKRGTEKDVE